jgi:hypothetical protein
MRFIKKVTQRLLDIRAARFAKEDGLINTTDRLVATAATVVLAAGVGGTVLSTLDESKYGKAQPDAQAIGQAIMTFYKDTGKWPGQYEDSLATTVTLLATAPITGGPELPLVANDGLEWDGLGSAKCGANSGQGFVNNSVAAGDFNDGTDPGEITGAAVLNLNDYLVRRPNSANYPNWAGPYVQEITTDPWSRAWIAYLAPLYCSEAVVDTSGVAINDGAGNLGYAWLISGGTNRTITTPAMNSNLDVDGDDTGVQMGKLTLEAQ